jgi:hypothetical protein
MGIHINERLNRGSRYCPLLREKCVKGWTPTMGKTEDGFPVEGLCAAWQPVSVHTVSETEGQKTVEVWDCSAFGWPADLATETAKEVFRSAATTDELRKEVRGQVRFFIDIMRKAKNRLLSARGVPGIGHEEEPGGRNGDSA